MRVYHGTTPDNAAAILAEGFQDGAGRDRYGFDVEVTGVWLSDRLLYAGEGGGIGTETLLCLELPEDAAWEVVEEGKPYREWLVPADVLNGYGPPAEVDPLDKLLLADQGARSDIAEIIALADEITELEAKIDAREASD